MTSVQGISRKTCSVNRWNWQTVTSSSGNPFQGSNPDTLEVLNEFPEVTGVVHCFSGSAETAKQLLNMGYYIGFTGVITFKNAKKTVSAAEVVPLTGC